MSETVTDAFAHLILQFRKFALQQLPVLEQEVCDLINRKETDCDSIELPLDVLLSMLNFGVGRELFNRLHQYYKNVNRQRFIIYQALAAEVGKIKGGGPERKAGTPTGSCGQMTGVEGIITDFYKR